MKKSRKILETLGSQASTVEGDKEQIDKLRAELDALNPKKIEINKEYDVVKAELKKLDDSKKKHLTSLNVLITEKKNLKTEIDALYEKTRTLRADFKKANDEWFQWERAERERKQKEYQAQKKKDEAERLARAAERELEDAEIPAFTDEINDCNTLISFLQGYLNPGTAQSSTSSTSNSTSQFAATSNLRKVENSFEGVVPLKKKDDREEDYMVMGKGKKKRGGSAASSSSPSRQTSSPPPPATPPTTRRARRAFVFFVFLFFARVLCRFPLFSSAPSPTSLKLKITKTKPKNQKKTQPPKKKRVDARDRGEAVWARQREQRRAERRPGAAPARGAGLPHRPLPGQRADRGAHRAALQQPHLRAALEPPVHPQRADHLFRKLWHRGARRLL